ncbi:MAG: UDP-2,3-diacylglucosamine diphosphatase LpxI [Desulfovibrio sp.]|nr:UDP-2,3-diacylglucosamine diphosphatase LpxI [Desulfovibrio sp.]
MSDASSGTPGKERIGIIAGSGQFPFLVARGAAERGLDAVICGILGNADPALAGVAGDFVMLPIGQLNKLIKFFKSRDVGRLCMAGAVSKVRALDIRPDFRAAGLILKLAGKGDDAVLRALVDVLQSEGFDVVRPDALVPDLRCAPGVLGKIQPDAYTRKDTEFGMRIAGNIGAMDIGQCVAVRRGIVVAVEAIEGTDAALIRGGELGGAGCTAVKVLKPGQDTRMDLPSIGTGTLEIMARYKYACLAFEAGGTLFFDRKAALALADAAGIAVVAF